MREKHPNQRNRKKLPLITGLAVMLAFLVLCLTACQAGGKKDAAVVTTEPTVQTEGAMAAVETTEKIEAVESSAPEETAAVALVADVPEVTEAAVVTVTGRVGKTDTLNVRADAGTAFAIVGTLKRNDMVTVYEKTAVDGVTWLRIDGGWVSGDYILLESGSLNDVPGHTEGSSAGDTVQPGHVHNYLSSVTKATCTVDGYTTYTCSCGDTYKGNFVNAVGHSYGEWVTTKEPTKTDVGTAQRKCAECGAVESKTLPKVVDGHTHSYTAKVTKEATCTTNGIRTYTCSCGDTYTESIAKTGHVYKDTVTKATCTTQGYTTHVCEVCGYSYRSDYTKAVGHSYGDWVTIKEPTTTSTGLASRTCTGCGISETKTLPKLEGTTPSTHTHSWGAWVEVAAGCTYDGYKYRTCSTCGAEETAVGASALGHSYVVTSETAATCTVNGSRVYTCSRCGDSYTETLTASHQWEHHDAVTHKGDPYVWCHCGWTGPTVDAWSQHCLSLGADYDANGHSYTWTAETIVDVPAGYYCSICGAKKST